MNQELATALKIYSTKPHKELNDYLIGKSKDNLIGILVDLITMYINDKNSSTIREFITVTLAGYEHEAKKIGYNGYKHDTYGKMLRCEAKPKNCDTNSENLYKLRGAGNFSDYTFARLKKDTLQDDLNMLVSGFVDGKLIYIIEFPFKCPEFVENLRVQLLKRFPKGQDITNEYLRSAGFDYRDFTKCNERKIVYLLTKKELMQFKPYIIRDFYNFLEEKTK
ncbi:MAG: hypothetical protein MUO17_06070 [Dehalococcoidales bacterium]|nr:hypothetical protein [Dehalococcoidales bacterium]